MDIIKCFIDISNYKDIFPKCKEDTIIDFVGGDQEIYFPRGYSLQFSATKEKNYAIPYFSDFWGGEKFKEKSNITYYFGFIGSPNTSIFRMESLRFLIWYHKVHKKNELHSYIKFREGYFHNIQQTEEKNKSDIGEYKNILENCKFNFCPMGAGLQSKRFFESISLYTIPVYIGPKDVKMPLDWIIRWDECCFRINIEDLRDGNAIKKMDYISSLSEETINEMRKKIFVIYNRYFKHDRFRSLIYEEIERNYNQNNDR